MASLFDNWGCICQLMFDNSQWKMQKCNYGARPSRNRSSKAEFDLKGLRQPLDPILKVEGKQVLK